jgi:hypothetical protein
VGQDAAGSDQGSEVAQAEAFLLGQGSEPLIELAPSKKLEPIEKTHPGPSVGELQVLPAGQGHAFRGAGVFHPKPEVVAGGPGWKQGLLQYPVPHR